MSTQNTVISFEQLVQDFDHLFKRRVFRLETLDWYDAENEHEPYARFLAGQPADPAWREPWKKLVREVRASGRTMQRVHVVSEPVSDYIRFELLHAYPANVAAGEDVRIIGRRTAELYGILRGDDYWLFDDGPAAVLEYDSEGRVAQVTFERDHGECRFLAADRDAILRLAVPLAEYVAEHNITERKHAA